MSFMRTACGERGADVRPDFDWQRACADDARQMRQGNIHQPKWRDTTKSGQGFVVGGAKPANIRSRKSRELRCRLKQRRKIIFRNFDPATARLSR
ncbi:hypothetical protein [Bradyrhizobium sp. Ash2021]|uniref:hypothetical protein n=1 Tax=Bradyrhizobium sp. Ash2021 TaxID=2954771 RepID=UPI002815D4B7|nr:hypothetical protein [Bradyrhizobium sp. Ash2021]WMT74494.1 hypothetical protein NL528_42570 [Bradyrhizobium sp. Ash2021]